MHLKHSNLENKTIYTPVRKRVSIIWICVRAERYLLILQILDNTEITVE